MPRINLLPWREAERKKRQRDFGVAAGRWLLLPLHVVVLGTMFAVLANDRQPGSRNQRLTNEIAELEKSIERDRRSGAAERTPAGAHGNHRAAAEEPPGNCASVRRARTANAGRRLSDRHEADRVRASSSRRRAVEHARFRADASG